MESDDKVAVSLFLIYVLTATLEMPVMHIHMKLEAALNAPAGITLLSPYSKSARERSCRRRDNLLQIDLMIGLWRS